MSMNAKLELLAPQYDIDLATGVRYTRAYLSSACCTVNGQTFSTNHEIPKYAYDSINTRAYREYMRNRLLKELSMYIVNKMFSELESANG